MSSKLMKDMKEAILDPSKEVKLIKSIVMDDRILEKNIIPEVAIHDKKAFNNWLQSEPKELGAVEKRHFRNHEPSSKLKKSAKEFMRTC